MECVILWCLCVVVVVFFLIPKHSSLEIPTLETLAVCDAGLHSKLFARRGPVPVRAGNAYIRHPVESSGIFCSCDLAIKNLTSQSVRPDTRFIRKNKNNKKKNTDFFSLQRPCWKRIVIAVDRGGSMREAASLGAADKRP